MKKSIITLLLALLLTPVAALAETPKPAAVGSDPNTVTVSRAYLDSLLDSVAQARSQRDIAAQATQQVADQLRSEMESRYNTYVTHVGWLIALFALIPGLVVPILITGDFKRDAKDNIRRLEKDIQTARINVDNAEAAAKDAKIFALFSQAYYEKDLDNKIALYTKILDIDPSYAEAYNNRDIAYGIKGEYNKAIEDYNQAIALKKDFAEAYNNRGNAYGIKGEYDKAIEDFTQAIALKKDFAEAYNNRGSAYDDKGEYDKAIEDFTQAIALKKDYAEAYYNRGNAYGIKGEYDKAIKDFTQAIALKKDFAEAYNNRGNAYRKKGEYDKAIEDCTQAIELDRDDANYYDSRADAYIIMKNYAEALNDVEEGLKRNPNDEVRKLLEEKQRICQEKLQG